MKKIVPAKGVVLIEHIEDCLGRITEVSGFDNGIFTVGKEVYYFGGTRTLVHSSALVPIENIRGFSVDE
jgi:hypothetical protein